MPSLFIGLMMVFFALAADAANPNPFPFFGKYEVVQVMEDGVIQQGYDHNRFILEERFRYDTGEAGYGILGETTSCPTACHLIRFDTQAVTYWWDGDLGPQDRSTFKKISEKIDLGADFYEVDYEGYVTAGYVRIPTYYRMREVTKFSMRGDTLIIQSEHYNSRDLSQTAKDLKFTKDFVLRKTN